MLVGLISAVTITAVLKLGEQIEFDYLVDTLQVYEVTNPLGNYLVNGDFDDPTGMTPMTWGYTGMSLQGWTSNTGYAFELHDSGWQGMSSVSGGYWLDTNASPGQLDIEQSVQNLEPDAVYRLTLFAGDRDADLDGEALVFWNGSLVGSIDPDQEDIMQEFNFFIREGDGDGSNRIRIVEIGSDDSNGLSLDEVRIWGR